MREKTNFAIVPMEEVPLQEWLHSTEELRPVVLVVHNEPLIADTRSAILNQNGFTAITAYDEISAMETAALIPPDLLITDAAMVGFNGLDLAVCIQDAIPACEIILMVGRASAVDHLAVARRANHECVSLLMKPLHPKAMLDQVTECLRLRGHHMVV